MVMFRLEGWEISAFSQLLSRPFSIFSWSKCNSQCNCNLIHSIHFVIHFDIKPPCNVPVKCITLKHLLLTKLIYGADTRTVNAEALFFLKLYFSFTYFVVSFRTGQAQPPVDVTAETFFLRFFDIIFKLAPWFRTRAETFFQIFPRSLHFLQ